MKIRIVVVYFVGDYYVDFVIRSSNNHHNQDDYICNSIKINDKTPMVSLHNNPFEFIKNFTYKKYRKLVNENKH